MKTGGTNCAAISGGLGTRQKIIVYCSSLSWNASREVAHRLRKEAQLSDVFVLEGGWEAWLKKNR